ncbi:hypothetical protein FQR65_LT20364 [Abscondita terminalis]|nr:hypothetical protein FQR65_LT20364 [Abscondita terminalis]
MLLLISIFEHICTRHYVLGAATGYLTGEKYYYNASDIYYLTSLYNGNTTCLVTFILWELKHRLNYMQSLTTHFIADKVKLKKTLSLIRNNYNRMSKVAVELNSIFELCLLIKFSVYLSYTLFVCFWFTSGTILGNPISYYDYVRHAGWLGVLVLDVTVNISHCVTFVEKKGITFC